MIIAVNRGLSPGAALAPLLAGAVAMCACRASLNRTSQHDRDIADVTIALPDGDEHPNPQHAASVMINRIGGADLVAGVVWQVGTFDEANARAIAESAAAKVGARPEPLSDDEIVVGQSIAHRSFRITAGGAPMWLTVFACGSHIFGVLAGGEGALDLHRRMLRSVRCHPASGDTRSGVPAIADLPAGWQRTASDPSQLTYEKDDETVVLSTMDIVADAQLQGVMESAARHIGNEAKLGVRHEVPGPDGNRAVWSGSFIGPSGLVLFQLSTWPCTGRSIALMMGHIGGADERSGMELFAHVRCARANETLPAR